ncbi:hypothetical protein [Leptospira ilyithenensis]|uniref:Uncharacterized protein n=1 Tax=Leptospira ilyithenensis TaxID=2484901 RepID=A0A4R9LUV6_9LEPT|nr:hypothetical protein [Leptospira ilyithenensis]TGN14705.1 hypothetical protein EHS11_01585 [Leptospira ilyithenensis]
MKRHPFQNICSIGFGGIVLFHLFLFSPSVLYSQESEAIKLELEAEDLEKTGDLPLAETKRLRAIQIRKKNFYLEKRYVYLRDPKDISHPLESGKQPFFGGTWEFGIRGNNSVMSFGGGTDWLHKDGKLAFQAGDLFFPRSNIPYQNGSVLPVVEEPKFLSSKLPSYSFSYRHDSKKWGFEYTSLPFQSSFTHYAWGLVGPFQFANYETRYRMQDHRFVIKIYEELTKDSWFSWDFGLRGGSWKTDSSYLSATLGQAGDLREQSRYLAPSAGFRFYHAFEKIMRLEVGADIFVTPLGRLDYQRSVTKEGGFGTPGNSLDRYSIQSNKPLEMTVTGIDLNFIYSVLLFNQHRLSLGVQSTSYAWKANESKMPNFYALSPETYGTAVMDWYKSSGVYEADGNGRRIGRYFGVSNIFIGYSYAF